VNRPVAPTSPTGPLSAPPVEEHDHPTLPSPITRSARLRDMCQAFILPREAVVVLCRDESTKVIVQISCLTGDLPGLRMLAEQLGAVSS
jgi:hypothetical protein